MNKRFLSLVHACLGLAGLPLFETSLKRLRIDPLSGLELSAGGGCRRDERLFIFGAISMGALSGDIENRLEKGISAYALAVRLRDIATSSILRILGLSDAYLEPCPELRDSCRVVTGNQLSRNLAECRQNHLRVTVGEKV